MPGRFVVLEGGDGSGKSTQAARLASRLRDRGVGVCETFEPGAGRGRGDPRAAAARPRTIAPYAEALLMAADRAQHVAERDRAGARTRGMGRVRPLLPSSLVYQGIVRGLGVDAVVDVNRLATDTVEPDVVIVLDVTDAVAVRAAWTVPPDRLEAEGDAFHDSVRAAYRDLAPAIAAGHSSTATTTSRRWRRGSWSPVEPLLAG